jgi:hypothetical protein
LLSALSGLRRLLTGLLIGILLTTLAALLAATLILLVHDFLQIVELAKANCRTQPSFPWRSRYSIMRKRSRLPARTEASRRLFGRRAGRGPIGLGIGRCSRRRGSRVTDVECEVRAAGKERRRIARELEESANAATASKNAQKRWLGRDPEKVIKAGARLSAPLKTRSVVDQMHRGVQSAPPASLYASSITQLGGRLPHSASCFFAGAPPATAIAKYLVGQRPFFRRSFRDAAIGRRHPVVQPRFASLNAVKTNGFVGPLHWSLQTGSSIERLKSY